MGPTDGLSSEPRSEPVTDEFCMQRVRNGDLHGFDLLFERHHHQARAAATTVAGPHLARELADEAFGRLLILLLDGGRPETAVRYFVYASLRESYRQRRLRRAHPSPPEEPGAAAPAPAPPVPRLPENWRPVLRAVLGDHLVAEESAPCLCRTAEIVLEITRSHDILSSESRPAAERRP